MTKNKPAFSPLIVIVLIVLVVGFVWAYKTLNSPSRLNAFHRDVYDGAKSWFVSDLKAEPVIAEAVEGEASEPVTRFHLSWEKPTKKYNHFLLTITNRTLNTKTLESGNSERVTLDLIGLDLDTEYTIALQACLDPSCKKWLVSKTEVSLTTDSAE